MVLVIQEKRTPNSRQKLNGLLTKTKKRGTVRWVDRLITKALLDGKGSVQWNMTPKLYTPKSEWKGASPMETTEIWNLTSAARTES